MGRYIDRDTANRGPRFSIARGKSGEQNVFSLKTWYRKTELPLENWQILVTATTACVSSWYKPSL